MKVRFVRRAPTQEFGRTLWIRIGDRLRIRRSQLGLSRSRVARELGIESRAYDAYEAGIERVPALLLTQLAELFDVPVFWFFEGIAPEKETAKKQVSRPCGVYRVATPEQRMHFLVDTFRKLDLEGQQHLLTLAGALSRTCRKGAMD